jgi:hypothetical protein
MCTATAYQPGFGKRTGGAVKMPRKLLMQGNTYAHNSHRGEETAAFKSLLM